MSCVYVEKVYAIVIINVFYTCPLLLYYAPYLLCIAVHLVTLQLVALVAHYPKWSSQSDRIPECLNKSTSDRIRQKALVSGQMLRVQEIASLFVKQSTQTAYSPLITLQPLTTTLEKFDFAEYRYYQ